MFFFVACLTNLSVFIYAVLDGMMTDESWSVKVLKGSYLGLIKELSWHLHGGTEENHENLRIGSDSAEIQITSTTQLYSGTSRPACPIRCF
jgi:hypothetical protein